MIRKPLVGAVLVTSALVVPVSAASAATVPVKQEVVIQLKKIRANPEVKSLQKFKVNNVSEAEKAIPKLNALKGVYTTAAAAVAKSSATTTAQKAGRADWVSAVRTNITGIGDLVTGLEQYVKGDKSAAQNTIDKGIKLDVTANQKSLKAYKLLGIKV